MMNYPYAKYTETLLQFRNENPDFLTNLFNDFQGKTLDNQNYSDMLYNAFVSHWDIYEIGAETEDLFKKYLTDTYNENKYEFLQKLKGYDISYNWNEGNTIEKTGNNVLDTTRDNTTSSTSELKGTDTTDSTTKRTDELSSSSNTKGATSNTSTNNTNRDDTHYDLPRTSSSENKPSEKDNVLINSTDTDIGENKSETTSTGENVYNTDVDGTLTRDHTTTGRSTYNSTGTDTNNYTEKTVDNTKMMRLKEEYMRQIKDLFRDFALRFHDCFIMVY